MSHNLHYLVACRTFHSLYHLWSMLCVSKFLPFGSMLCNSESLLSSQHGVCFKVTITFAVFCTIQSLYHLWGLLYVSQSLSFFCRMLYDSEPVPSEKHTSCFKISIFFAACCTIQSFHHIFIIFSSWTTNWCPTIFLFKHFYHQRRPMCTIFLCVTILFLLTIFLNIASLFSFWQSSCESQYSSLFSLFLSVAILCSPHNLSVCLITLFFWQSVFDSP